MNKKTKKDQIENGRTTFNSIKGTKVYDADGEVFGHVSDIEINRSTLNPTKLIIHKGFFGEYLRVNLKYVDKITSDSIHLWISPAKNLVGANVLDSEGTNIGVVREAEKDKTGDLEYIRVESKILRTMDDEEQIEAYTVPMMSFDDMSITLPTSPLEEGPIATHIDVNREDIIIESEDIIDVGKDCIKLAKKKEEYIKYKE